MISHDRAALLEKLAGRRVVASISGGKDSAAMSLYLRELGIDHDRVFLDTGWEHEKTYEYLRGDLTRCLGPITEVSSAHKMVATILRKGIFPSRKTRFCTQELKIFPMQKHLAKLADAGLEVVNAVGIRHGESLARAQMAEWEWSDGFDCETWRPLTTWTEDDVIAIHARHGLRPNPLYLLGAARVGCWPCIYARKDEIRLISEVDPERIDLIERLEARVAARSAARSETDGVRPSWFANRLPATTTCQDCGGEPFAGPPLVSDCPACDGCGNEGEELAVADDDGPCPRCDGAGVLETSPLCRTCNGRGTRRLSEPWPIRRVVEWSRTARGGRQFELFQAPPSDAGCMRWGLCETEEP